MRLIQEYNGADWNEEQLAQLNLADDNEIPQAEREANANAAMEGLTAGQFGDLANSLVKVDDEEFACAICTEAFNDDDEVRELKCRHIFHTKCLKPWLEKKLECPMCRAEIN